MIFATLTLSAFATNDTSKIRVFFKDKNVQLQNYEIIKQELAKQISKDAYTRRLINLKDSNLVIDTLDFPVSSNYINTILDLGARLFAQSRWFNYALFEADSVQIEKIKELPFVKYIQFGDNKLIPLEQTEHKESLYGSTGFINSEVGYYNYGGSFRQNVFLNIDKLHEYGVNGEDVIIGIIDCGFIYTRHKSLQHLKVLKEFDYARLDAVVSHEPATDRLNHEQHGTQVLSVISSLAQDSLIGIAHKSSVMLAKSEVLEFERHIEEDYFIAAVECLEWSGVDVINSSLGYQKFDNQNQNYTPNDLNGSKLLISNSLNIATQRGVMCVVAAGNSGEGGLSTLGAPADSDSAFTVGSVGINKNLSNFSSKGNPSFKIKPDFITLGEDVRTVNNFTSEKYLYSRGTSFASPAIAGSLSLLKSLHPTIMPWQAKKILKDFSSNSNYPDNRLGWGIPDIFKSAKEFGSFITPLSSYPINKFQRFVTYLFANEIADITLYAKIKRWNNDYYQFKFYQTNIENQYAADIPFEEIEVNEIECYAVLTTYNSTNRYPILERRNYKFKTNEIAVEPGINPELLPVYSIEKNSPFVYQGGIVAETVVNFILNKTTDADVRIYDYKGNEHYKIYIPEREQGIVTININQASLPIGLYIAQIRKNYEVEYLKILITK